MDRSGVFRVIWTDQECPGPYGQIRVVPSCMERSGMSQAVWTDLECSGLPAAPRRSKAPSSLRGCGPPCLSMRNNAPMEHCVAEVFFLHRRIVRTMKPDLPLRAYLMIEITGIAQ